MQLIISVIGIVLLSSVSLSLCVSAFVIVYSFHVNKINSKFTVFVIVYRAWCHCLLRRRIAKIFVSNALHTNGFIGICVSEWIVTNV